jgi:predicted nucleotidyltransferase
MARPTDFEGLLRALLERRVEFVVIGGLAATIHGSARSTLDLDIVYRRTPDNVARLVAVLAPLVPALRGAPAGLPFRLDVPTVERGLNFTLDTALGSLDLLGEVVGGGRYEDLLAHTQMVRLFGHECRCVTLQALIALKRAAGRPKDNEILAELEILLERQNTDGP